jgi:hypothetical protein
MTYTEADCQSSPAFIPSAFNCIIITTIIMFMTVTVLYYDETHETIAQSAILINRSWVMPEEFCVFAITRVEFFNKWNFMRRLNLNRLLSQTLLHSGIRNMRKCLNVVLSVEISRCLTEFRGRR